MTKIALQKRKLKADKRQHPSPVTNLISCILPLAVGNGFLSPINSLMVPRIAVLVLGTLSVSIAF